MNPATPPKRKARPKAAVDARYCVACGCCLKVCPMSAIVMVKGLRAQVNEEKCVGCGKCVLECPASVIRLKEVSL